MIPKPMELSSTVATMMNNGRFGVCCVVTGVSRKTAPSTLLGRCAQRATAVIGPATYRLPIQSRHAFGLSGPQTVTRRQFTENPRVGSSILPLATNKIIELRASAHSNTLATFQYIARRNALFRTCRRASLLRVLATEQTHQVIEIRHEAFVRTSLRASRSLTIPLDEYHIVLLLRDTTEATTDGGPVVYSTGWSLTIAFSRGHCQGQLLRQLHLAQECLVARVIGQVLEQRLADDILKGKDPSAGRRVRAIAEQDRDRRDTRSSWPHKTLALSAHRAMSAFSASSASALRPFACNMIGRNISRLPRQRPAAPWQARPPLCPAAAARRRWPGDTTAMPGASSSTFRYIASASAYRPVL